MRQTGILSAACLVSLMDWEEKLSEDNKNAAFLAQELADCSALIFDPSLVETNIVKFKLDKEVSKKLKIDHEGLAAKLKEEHSIWVGTGFHNDHVRLVTHRGTSKEHCERASKAIKQIL